MKKIPNYSIPILLVAYEIVLYLSNDMYLPALPQMMDELELNVSQIQLTLTLWFFGSASMPLLAGGLADRYGRRRVLLCGGAIYFFADLSCLVVQNYASMLMLRFLQGGMVPTMLVPGYACIHESYEQKKAILILAFMSSIAVLAPAFGPFLGSMVLTFGSWRLIFALIAVLTFLVITLLYFFMPETLTKAKQQNLNILRLSKSALQVLNHRFILLGMALGFMFIASLTWVTSGPLLIISSFHHSAIYFGVAQLGIFSLYILGNQAIKVLLKKHSANRLITIGLYVALSFALLMLVSAVFLPQALEFFLVLMGVFCFGSALALSPLNRLLIESSEEPMGIRVGMLSVCISGSAALGSLASSLFFNGSMRSIATIIVTALTLSFLSFYFYRMKFKP